LIQKKHNFIRGKKGSTVSCTVHFYDGYKGSQTPREVIIGEETHLVTEVLDQKRTAGPESGKITEIFKCRLDSGGLVLISVKEPKTCQITSLP